jgi:hypothetical protein
MSLPPDSEVALVPENDKDGIQKVYEAMAKAIQGMPESKHPRFAFWALVAVINLLCRLAINHTSMTKEQLMSQVGGIFAGCKNEKTAERLMN